MDKPSESEAQRQLGNPPSLFVVLLFVHRCLTENVMHVGMSGGMTLSGGGCVNCTDCTPEPALKPFQIQVNQHCCCYDESVRFDVKTCTV